MLSDFGLPYTSRDQDLVDVIIQDFWSWVFYLAPTYSRNLFCHSLLVLASYIGHLRTHITRWQPAVTLYWFLIIMSQSDLTTSQKKAKNTGTCEVCFGLFKLLRRDGSLAKHGPRDNPCAGSYTVPISGSAQKSSPPSPPITGHDPSTANSSYGKPSLPLPSVANAQPLSHPISNEQDQPHPALSQAVLQKSIDRYHPENYRRTTKQICMEWSPSVRASHPYQAKTWRSQKELEQRHQ